MTTTQEAINFIRETRNTLGMLTERLSGIRYDLFGSRSVPGGEAPTPPKAPIDINSMAFTDAIEYFAGDINASLNKFMDEVEFLSSHINHKEVAIAPATPTALGGKSY